MPMAMITKRPSLVPPRLSKWTKLFLVTLFSFICTGCVHVSFRFVDISQTPRQERTDEMNYLTLKFGVGLVALLALTYVLEINHTDWILLMWYVAMIAWMADFQVADNYFTRKARSSFQHILDGIGSYYTT
jgi:hypothetical protein